MKTYLISTLLFATCCFADSKRSEMHDTSKPTDKSNITATSQGSSPGDMATTQKIRAALVDSDLSTAAKNLVVVTENGTVTIKGTVPTQAEADRVMATAARFVDRSQLKNQVTVGSAD